MQQLDALGIGCAQDGRLGQAVVTPGAMGLEQPKQACPLGQPGEQRPPIALQPAVEGPVANVLEGEQSLKVTISLE